MTQWGRCWIGIAVMAAVSAGCADGGTGRAADLGTTIPAASVTESPSTSGPVSETPTLIPLPAGATLTFTPANPTAGQETTLTATGCPLGDRIVFAFYASDGSSFVPNPSDTRLEATSVSSTTATTYRFRFPDNAFGPVLVQGVCIDSATGQFAFAYDQFPAVVSTKRHLSVKPATTIAAGTTLEIAPLGPPCIGALVDVLVGLSPVHPYSAKPAPSAGITVTLPEVSTPNWHAELVIPASLATGSYRIEASCSRSRGVLAVWEPTIVQVVPAN